MDKLARFRVTVPEEILKEFDAMLSQSGNTNRSDVIRRLIRNYVAEERWREEKGEVYGTVTLMYDHHSPCLSKLTPLQHEHGDAILCTTHVHVDRSTCLECIVLRGDAANIKTFVHALEKITGLKSVDTVITSGI